MMRPYVLMLLASSALMAEDKAEAITFVRPLSASFVEITCVHMEFGRILKKQVNVINRNAIVRIAMSNHDGDGPLPGGDPPVNYRSKYTYRLILDNGGDLERAIPCGIHFVHDVTEKVADEWAASFQMPDFHEIPVLIDQNARH